jgi:hypothetical protein
MNLADAEKCGTNLLGGHLFAVLAFEAQRFFIVRHGLIERPHGDSEVINFLKHKNSKVEIWTSRVATPRSADFQSAISPICNRQCAGTHRQAQQVENL